MRVLRWIAMIVFVLGLVGCDQGAKRWAEERLQRAPAVEVVPDVLDLTYTRNHHIAFSLLRGIPQKVLRPALIVVGSAMVLLICWFWAHAPGAPHPPSNHLGFALVLAGALGNLADRIARGYVVDFIHLHHWPVFNVADICVGAGVALLLLPAIRARGAPS